MQLEQKARTWVEPYERAGGARVGGYWRRSRQGRWSHLFAVIPTSDWDGINALLDEVNKWPQAAPEEGGASPRIYALEAISGVAGVKDDRLSVIAVRNAEEDLVGVGTVYADDATVYLRVGAAVRGGGMPLFASVLELAGERGAGLRFTAGNERAGKLYDKLKIPKERTEYRDEYVLTPEQVLLLSEDVFAFAHQKDGAKGRVWVKPYRRGDGITVAGYWRGLEDAGAGGDKYKPWADLPDLPENMSYARPEDRVWMELPDGHINRPWKVLERDFMDEENGDERPSRIVAINLARDDPSLSRTSAGTMIVELHDNKNPLDTGHDVYMGPFFHNPELEPEYENNYAILDSMYIAEQYRGRGYARRWAEWLEALDRTVYGSFTNYGLMDWFYDNFGKSLMQRSTKARTWVKPYAREGEHVVGYWRDVADRLLPADDEYTQLVPGARMRVRDDAGLHWRLLGQEGRLTSFDRDTATVSFSSLPGMEYGGSFKIKRGDLDMVAHPKSPQDEETRTAMRVWRGDFSWSTNLRAIIEGREPAPAYKDDRRMAEHARVLDAALDKADDLGEPSLRLVPGKGPPEVGGKVSFSIAAVGFRRDWVEDYRKTFLLDLGDTPTLYFLPPETKGIYFPDGQEAIIRGDFLVDSVEWNEKHKVYEAKLRAAAGKAAKGRIWIKPYVRADGGHVAGYWRSLTHDLRAPWVDPEEVDWGPNRTLWVRTPESSGHYWMKDRVPWTWYADKDMLVAGSPGSDHLRILESIPEEFRGDFEAEWNGVWIIGNGVRIHGWSDRDSVQVSDVTPEMRARLRGAFGSDAQVELNLLAYDEDIVSLPNDWELAPHLTSDVRVRGAPFVSQAGWTMRPENGPESYLAHADSLYERLKAMSPEERHRSASGGNLPASGQSEKESLAQVIRGEKPATLIPGDLSEQINKRKLKEMVEQAGGTPLGWESGSLGYQYDSEMQHTVVSRSPAAAQQLDLAYYLPPRSAYRNVLVGVALGYSDADIAKFFDRDLFFDWEDETKGVKNRVWVPPHQRFGRPVEGYFRDDPRSRRVFNVPDVRFDQTKDYAAFNDMLRKNPMAWNFTFYEPDELKKMRVFMSEDGSAGFAIKPDGDLVNVCANKRGGAGRAIMVKAIEEGAKTLDCYAGFLPQFYSRFGFAESARLKFNPEFAPPDMPEDQKKAAPDVVFMRYVGGPRNTVRNRIDFYKYVRSREYVEDWDEGKLRASQGAPAKPARSARGKSGGGASSGVGPVGAAWRASNGRRVQSSGGAGGPPGAGLASVKRIWVKPYRRGDGTLVAGYWRIGAELEAAEPDFDHVSYVRDLNIGALLVGGSVRDELLGRPAKDGDYLVPGKTVEELRVELNKHGRTEPLEVGGRTVGIRFHPTEHPGESLEFAPPRKEISTGPGRQDFDIVADPSVSIEEDARRRDFTINAIYKRLGKPAGNFDYASEAATWPAGTAREGRLFTARDGERVIGRLEVWKNDDPYPSAKPWVIRDISVEPEYRRMGVGSHLFQNAQEELGPIAHNPIRSEDGEAWMRALKASSADDEIIDPLGGAEDLKNGILRTTSPDSFRDDPLRMMRGLRFMSTYGFDFDSSEPKDRVGKEIAEARFGEAHGLQTTTRVFVAYLPIQATGSTGSGFADFLLGDSGGESRLPMAALTVDEKEGTVELVFTQEEYRRRGLAKALLEVARRETGLPLDKDTGERSSSGRAFAEAVGLGSTKPVRKMDDREMHARGSGLMVGVYRGDVTEVVPPADWKPSGYGTREQMIAHADAISEVSGERIGGGIEGAQGELTRLLQGDYVKKALSEARDTGILGRILPELEPTFGFDQQSRYHGMTADQHIFSVVEAAQKKHAPVPVLLAALFHDSGKPESAWADAEGKLHYYANDELGKRPHEDIGAEKAQAALTRLKYPTEVRTKVVKLVQSHMFQDHKKPTEARARRFLNRHGDDLAFDLVRLKRADIMGKGEVEDSVEMDPASGLLDLIGGNMPQAGELALLDKFEGMLREAQGQPHRLSDLAIDGSDLVALGIPEGPQIGALLDHLMNQVLSSPNLNTREWLLAEARRWNRKQGKGVKARTWVDPYFRDGGRVEGYWRIFDAAEEALSHAETRFSISMESPTLAERGITRDVPDNVLTAFKARKEHEDAIWKKQDLAYKLSGMADGVPAEKNWKESAVYRAAIAEVKKKEEARVKAEGSLGGGTVFRLPNWQVGKARDRIDTLAKRAEKLGLEPPTLKKEGEELVDLSPPGQEGMGEKKRYVYVSVTGTAPKIAGWSFLASIQHLDGNNVLRRVPGSDEDVSLDKYREAEPNCDHCGKARMRKDTFIVQNEEGELKQVGRQCLRDFLGHANPQQIVGYLEGMDTFGDFEAESDVDTEGREGRPRSYMSLPGYLTHVVTMMRSRGWVPRSAAGWDQRATADEARSNYYAWVNQERDKQGRQLWEDPTDEDKAKAELALAWAREELAAKTKLSDYEHNLVALATGEYVPERGEGYLASLIPAYMRAMEQKIEYQRRQEIAQTSEHVGKIGDRMKMKLRVENIWYHEGDYGTTYITKFSDENGNIIKWFGSYELDQGKLYEGTWRIKDHAEFRGAKETVVTRPTKLEKVDESGKGVRQKRRMWVKPYVRADGEHVTGYWRQAEELVERWEGNSAWGYSYSGSFYGWDEPVVYMDDRPVTKPDEKGQPQVFWKAFYFPDSDEMRLWFPTFNGAPHHEDMGEKAWQEEITLGNTIDLSGYGPQWEPEKDDYALTQAGEAYAWSVERDPHAAGYWDQEDVPSYEELLQEGKIDILRRVNSHLRGYSSDMQDAQIHAEAAAARAASRQHITVNQRKADDLQVQKHLVDALGPEAAPDFEDYDMTKVPEFVFRTMSEEHFQRSLKEGLHVSDRRDNYIAHGEADWDEGTVAGYWPELGYLGNAPGGVGRVVKIRVEPGDGWQKHRVQEDYLSIYEPIPVSRFAAWTDPIQYDRETGHAHLLEQRAQKAATKGRLWIKPYVRADGTRVAGHWRATGEALASAEGIKGFLQNMRTLVEMHGKPDGLAYSSHADFLLREGRSFTPQTWAEANKDGEYEQGKLRECYKNALELVLQHPDLTYVEGYAYGSILPVQHAWAVDRDGKVIDPTWSRLEGDLSEKREYFGVPFSRDYVLHTVLENEVYGVFGDFNIDIYREPLPDDAKVKVGRKGRIWIKPYRRDGKPVAGYWRDVGSVIGEAVGAELAWRTPEERKAMAFAVANTAEVKIWIDSLQADLRNQGGPARDQEELRAEVEKKARRAVEESPLVKRLLGDPSLGNGKNIITVNYADLDSNPTHGEISLSVDTPNGWKTWRATAPTLSAGRTYNPDAATTSPNGVPVVQFPNKLGVMARADAEEVANNILDPDDLLVALSGAQYERLRRGEKIDYRSDEPSQSMYGTRSWWDLEHQFKVKPYEEQPRPGHPGYVVALKDPQHLPGSFSEEDVRVAFEVHPVARVDRYEFPLVQALPSDRDLEALGGITTEQGYKPLFDLHDYPGALAGFGSSILKTDRQLKAMNEGEKKGLSDHDAFKDRAMKRLAARIDLNDPETRAFAETMDSIVNWRKSSYGSTDEERLAAQVIKSWAHSSSDEHVFGHYMQWVAAQEFDVPLNEWVGGEKFREKNPEHWWAYAYLTRTPASYIQASDVLKGSWPYLYNNVSPKDTKEIEAGARKVLRAMYAGTQEDLAELPVDQFLLWRGMRDLSETRVYGEIKPRGFTTTRALKMEQRGRYGDARGTHWDIILERPATRAERDAIQRVDPGTKWFAHSIVGGDGDIDWRDGQGNGVVSIAAKIYEDDPDLRKLVGVRTRFGTGAEVRKTYQGGSQISYLAVADPMDVKKRELQLSEEAAFGVDVIHIALGGGLRDGRAKDVPEAVRLLLKEAEKNGGDLEWWKRHLQAGVDALDKQGYDITDRAVSQTKISDFLQKPENAEKILGNQGSLQNVVIKGEVVPDWLLGGVHLSEDVRANPMSSHATTQASASTFEGGKGAFLVGIVPKEDIIGLPGTAYGCLEENEAVALGRKRRYVVIPSDQAIPDSAELVRMLETGKVPRTLRPSSTVYTPGELKKLPQGIAILDPFAIGDAMESWLSEDDQHLAGLAKDIFIQANTVGSGKDKINVGMDQNGEYLFAYKEGEQPFVSNLHVATSQQTFRHMVGLLAEFLPNLTFVEAGVPAKKSAKQQAKPEMESYIFIDTPENADWPKRVWDFSDVDSSEALDAWLESIHDTPEHFVTLPVFRYNVGKLPWLAEWAGQHGVKSQKAASPKVRSWHITDNPKFSLDPARVGQVNSTLGGAMKEPGIFVTQDPEFWVNGHNYIRPFIAEIEHPAEIGSGYYEAKDQYLPARLYGQSKVKRLIPLDEWVRETYHEPGWIEEGLGDKVPPIPSDYHYTGPDVRDMPPEQVQRYMDRTAAYIENSDRRWSMLRAYDEATGEYAEDAQGNPVFEKMQWAYDAHGNPLHGGGDQPGRIWVKPYRRADGRRVTGYWRDLVDVARVAKGRIWIKPYRRADGTSVAGFWRHLSESAQSADSKPSVKDALKQYVLMLHGNEGIQKAASDLMAGKDGEGPDFDHARTLMQAAQEGIDSFKNERWYGDVASRGTSYKGRAPKPGDVIEAPLWSMSRKQDVAASFADRAVSKDGGKKVIYRMFDPRGIDVGKHLDQNLFGDEAEFLVSGRFRVVSAEKRDVDTWGGGEKILVVTVMPADEKSAKGRVWVDSYRRRHGDPVRGHWRNITRSPLPDKFADIGEAEDWFRSQGLQADLAELNDDLDSVHEMARAVDDMLKRFPSLRENPEWRLGGIATYASPYANARVRELGQGGSMATENMSHETAEHAEWMTREGYPTAPRQGGPWIFINQDAYHGEDGIFGEIGFTASKGPYESMMHELGHAVHMSGLDKYRISSEQMLNVFQRHVDELWDTPIKRRKKLSRDISVYGMSPREETFAEVFVRLNSPRSFAQVTPAGQKRLKELQRRVNSELSEWLRRPVKVL